MDSAWVSWAWTELGFVAARKQSQFENPILRFDSHFDSTFCSQQISLCYYASLLVCFHTFLITIRGSRNTCGMIRARVCKSCKSLSPACLSKPCPLAGCPAPCLGPAEPCLSVMYLAGLTLPLLCLALFFAHLSWLVNWSHQQATVWNSSCCNVKCVACQQGDRKCVLTTFNYYPQSLDWNAILWLVQESSNETAALSWVMQKFPFPNLPNAMQWSGLWNGLTWPPLGLTTSCKIGWNLPSLREFAFGSCKTNPSLVNPIVEAAKNFMVSFACKQNPPPLPFYCLSQVSKACVLAWLNPRLIHMGTDWHTGGGEGPIILSHTTL